jgi:hypothetical protein
MAAIARELTPDINQVDEVDDDEPDIETGEGRAGRETLAAIASEMLHDIKEDAPTQTTRTREGRHTVSYEDRTAPTAPRARATTMDYAERPATTRRSRGVGLGALDDQLARWAQAGREAPRKEAPGDTPDTAPVPEDFEIHEMVTFVVRGDVARLSSDTARRDFVRDRLMHRLPVDTLDAVDRIDVTPWTVRGTVIVRVWCRI